MYRNGKPKKYAAELIGDPAAKLKDISVHFENYSGLKIALISDMDVSYAIPLACMGAYVTVFGVFHDCKRYAMQTAETAGVNINYEICDVLTIEESFFGIFDAVIIRKAAIHYFYDVETLFMNFRSMLKQGGRLLCMDFHPFYKDNICCASKHPFSFIQRQLPETCEKRFAITDILQAVLSCGLSITSFDEDIVTDETAARTLANLIAENN